MHKFIHGEEEYTVTTQVLKGGAGFLLQDKVTKRNLSDVQAPLSASELAEQRELLHNQCSFGELDTVTHLIETVGVSPNALDKVSYHS